MARKFLNEVGMRLMEFRADDNVPDLRAFLFEKLKGIKVDRCPSDGLIK